MGTRLDFEKDRRNRLPRDTATDCQGISEELERAAKFNTPTSYVRRADASEDLRKLRDELYDAVKIASTDAFALLCPPDDRRVHSYNLTKAAPVLRRLDQIPNKLLFGYSNAKLSAADGLIGAAKRLAVKFEKRIVDVRKLDTPRGWLGSRRRG